MKRAAIIILLMILISSVFAGIDEFYSFNAGTNPYTPITGTAITDNLSDDALSAAVPVGFSFPYGETLFTEVKVSSNGWIGLGTSATSSNLSNNLAQTETFPYIAPLWDDTSLASGSCAYLTSGTTPNRIFTVQYTNLRWNYSSDNQFNFQVKFHENGKIQFNYGAATGTPGNASASIGIMMPPGGSGWFYSVTPGTPSTVSTTASNNNLNVFPPINTLFEFVPLVASPNDLTCNSLTGNTTPSINTPTVYTVTVRNRGTAVQSVYSVKLVTSTGTELASVPGTTIQPLQNLVFQLNWTPTVQGPVILRGKVVLAGDANPGNDQSPPLNVTVMPEGMNVITVGTGDQQALIPVNMFYRNSLYETLIYPTEIGLVGNISAITFYNNFQTNLPDKPIKIWLGTTTNADLTGGWIPSTQLTQVFNGTVSFPPGTNSILIPLQTIFTYTGGNLVMMVNRPMDTTYFSSMDVFLCQTVGENRALNVWSDGTEYDPAAPPVGAGLTGQFPKTSLHMNPQSPNPMFISNPTSVSFGQVLMNTSRTRAISVLNAGGGSLGINSISVSGSPFFTLSGLPTLPQNLTTGQSINFTLNYNPTAAGEHTGTITIVDNVTRQTHTIPLSATCVDATVYTLPYAQNFDAATVPQLPLTWSSLIQTTSTNAYIRTQSSQSVSAPNAVDMYNYDDMEAGLYLISAPLATGIPTTNMRIKFQGRSNSTGRSVIVGIMTNSQNAASFTPIQTVDLGQTWTQCVVPLSAYTGTGRYIAFKHGGVGTYTDIYIDDFLAEVIPANDLAALAISGNTTPSAGSQTLYTVPVFNWGTATQSNYLVKLFSSTDLELGSAPGTSVAAGQTVQIQVPWTPSAPGSQSIYGKVVLTGDENSLNDQSPLYTVQVQPAGTLAVTIGDGSQDARLPVDMYWRNSLFETIYYPNELGIYGSINTLVFYNNFAQNLPNMPTKVWLGITTQNDLSAGWIPSTQLTLVFDGTVNYPQGLNTITIPLQTPFVYTGGNLVMMVNRPMDTQYYSSTNYFKCQTIGANRSLNVQSDGTLFDPAAPPTGNLSGSFPRTTMFMTALGTDPVFMINPASKNYGTVLLNTTHNQIFTVTNAGGGPLTVSAISYAGSEFMSLLNLPALPIQLTTGQNFQFTARYNPTAVGTHTGTITITDNMATRSSGTRSVQNRQVHTVALSGNCIDATITTLPYLQDFNAVTIPELPVTWSKLIQSTTTNTTIVSTSDISHSPANSILLNSGGDEAPNMLLISPPIISTTSLNTMRTKFWARGSEGYSLIVGVMTNPQDASTFVQTGVVNLNPVWTEHVVTFASYTGTGHYAAFKHGAGGTYRTIYIDDVLLEVTPQNDLAALSLMGNATPSVGAPSIYTVNVFNWGLLAQNTYTVKLFKQNGTEIGSAAGLNVNPGQTVSVPVSWTPDLEGPVTIYAKTVLATDQNTLNDQSPNFNVVVQPQGLVTITVGAGDQEARIPIDFWWRNSLFETMYYPAELGNTIGIIYGVSFYNNFPVDLMTMPTKVWLGTTTQADLSAGWIPSTQLQLVFDGTVNYPTGENVINISFTTPYLYLTGGNLVMMVNRPMDTQYYSSGAVFKSQTVGESRSRKLYSDSDEYDPTAPADGALVSGQFPKTTFFVIPGGVGHITGTVLGAGNQPLAGVSVQFQTGGYTAVTNAQGQYAIQNIISENYNVTFSKFGYVSQTLAANIQEDQTLTLNVTLAQMAMVNVSGTILGSDTAAGLNGAAIHLTGYENYTANTNAAGAFTIPGVYANNNYNYSIMCPGYTAANGTVNVGSTNHNMGSITLLEVAYAPNNVVAEVTPNGQLVNLSWAAPNPNATELTEGFEPTTFPPLDWTQTVTNTDPANTSGVYPTWCRFGNITIGTTPVVPPEGSWQAGLWWSYNHQNEWLITPTFNCPPSAYLNFKSYVFLGSTAGDHYYVKVSTDNGNTWTPLWDASAQTGGWNYYASPINLDLSAYGGQQLKIAWHAVDPPTNDGLWYVWFMDDIYIGNARETVRFAWNEMQTSSSGFGKAHPGLTATTLPSRYKENGSLRSEPALPLPHQVRSSIQDNRFLTGYKVWRLVQGQEANPANWTSLTPVTITATGFQDVGWGSLPDGPYRWAVKAVYSNDVLSVASFSNTIVALTETGMISGVVRQQNNQPIPGAVITAGTYTATTNNSGAYSIVAETGTYSVHVSANNYQGQTVENVIVIPNQTTTVNFILIPGSGTDDPAVPVTRTELLGNYPNPFNPSTTISYALKDNAPVELLIYNLKGQKVKTLVRETQSSGRYHVIWNGRDETGRAVSSGVYHYILRAGTFKATRKMLLVE